MATILVVEDDAANRQFLTALLGYRGHHILEAADGAEALAQVRAEHPALVIADVLMPTIDGYEFVRQLRSDPDMARTPVIFYTATYHEREARALAEASGVSHLIVKPSDPEVILGIVNSALSVPPPPPPAFAYAEFDREHLRLVTDTLSEKEAELKAANLRLATGFRGTSEQRYRVLLVEDNLAEARWIREKLLDEEGAPFEIESAGRLATGLSRLRAEDIDVVLLDLGLPDSQGRDTFTRVQSQAPHVPIIMLTGMEDEELAVELVQEGAQDYLVKGRVDRNRLVGAIRYAIERKRSEQQIRRLNEQLEQRVVARTAELAAVNKELETFTYSIAHDLRAPLRHMDGFSKILLEEFGPRLDPVAQQHLQRIQEAAQHMGQLVDDLLNLARVGRRGMNVQMRSLDVLVEESVADLEREAQGRQIDWQIARLPLVQCDPGLMKQVFANLLSNALKFTRSRERAVIEVGHTAEEGRAVIFVRDNGVGFDMKYADKLFGVFQRLHRQEDFEGTGVGLAIVQRIIHKHGGCLWAEAEVNKGATFYFSLALAREVREEPVPTKGGEACQQRQ